MEFAHESQICMIMLKESTENIQNGHEMVNNKIITTTQVFKFYGDFINIQSLLTQGRMKLH